VYVVVFVRVPVLSLPEEALLPDQPFEAVHPTTLLAFHVSVEDCPELIIVGEAEKTSVGVGGVLTVTVYDDQPDAWVLVSSVLALKVYEPSLPHVYGNCTAVPEFTYPVY
jgi:hypothetical protein